MLPLARVVLRARPKKRQREAVAGVKVFIDGDSMPPAKVVPWLRKLEAEKHEPVVYKAVGKSVDAESAKSKLLKAGIPESRIHIRQAESQAKDAADAILSVLYGRHAGKWNVVLSNDKQWFGELPHLEDEAHKSTRWFTFKELKDRDPRKIFDGYEAHTKRSLQGTKDAGADTESPVALTADQALFLEYCRSKKTLYQSWKTVPKLAQSIMAVYGGARFGKFRQQHGGGKKARKLVNDDVDELASLVRADLEAQTQPPEPMSTKPTKPKESKKSKKSDLSALRAADQALFLEYCRSKKALYQSWKTVPKLAQSIMAVYGGARFGKFRQQHGGGKKARKLVNDDVDELASLVRADLEAQTQPPEPMSTKPTKPKESKKSKKSDLSALRAADQALFLKYCRSKKALYQSWKTVPKLAQSIMSVYGGARFGKFRQQHGGGKKARKLVNDDVDELASLVRADLEAQTQPPEPMSTKPTKPKESKKSKKSDLSALRAADQALFLEYCRSKKALYQSWKTVPKLAQSIMSVYGGTRFGKFRQQHGGGKKARKLVNDDVDELASLVRADLEAQTQPPEPMSTKPTKPTKPKKSKKSKKPSVKVIAQAFLEEYRGCLPEAKLSINQFKKIFDGKRFRKLVGSSKHADISSPGAAKVFEYVRNLLKTPKPIRGVDKDCLPLRARVMFSMV